MKALVVAATLLTAGTAWADTVSGTVRYENRTYNASGFTGTEFLPVRHAEIEIVRSDGTVLGSGATLADGTYSVVIANGGTQSIFLRVYARRVNASFNASVRNNPSSNAIYTAVTTPAALDTSAPIVIDLDTTLAGAAPAFNIFDCAIFAFEYVASVDPSFPAPPPLVSYWQPGSTDGTYFDGSSVHLLGASSDTDEYDDDVILHEFGHYASFNWSQDDSPGGPHSVVDQLDARLSWSEGWATYFSAAVRRFAGAVRYPSPQVYVDTFASGTFTMNIETPSFSAQAVTARNELAVSTALWDLTDPANEAFDALPIVANPVTEDDVWLAFEALPGSTNVTLEDFFIEWSGVVSGPEVTATAGTAVLDGVFKARSIRYYADPAEANNTSGTATALVLPAALPQRTLFGVGDEDWFSGVVPVGTVQATLAALGDGIEPVLQILAGDGTTVLGAGSTSVIATLPAGGTFFVRLSSANGITQFGYGDLSVQFVPNLPPSISAIQVSERIALQPARLTFLATAGDPDGTIARYEWDFDGDGAFDLRSTEGPDATFTYDRAGSFTALLRVVDNLGDSASSSLVVSIDPNGAFAGTVSTSMSSPNAPSTVTATASIPGARAYEWDFNGDNVPDAMTTASSAAWTYRVAGSFAVRATARDESGRAVRVTSPVFAVGAGTNPPSVTLGAAPAIGVLPLNTTLTASATDDGVVVRYEWDIDSDGRLDAITTAPTLAWRYERVGAWTARVTAVDDTGLAASDTVLVQPTQLGPAGWLLEPRNEGASGPVTLTADLFPNGVAKSVRIQRDGVDIAGPIGVVGTRFATTVSAVPGTLRVVVDGVAGETTVLGSGGIVEGPAKSKDIDATRRTRFFFGDVELDFPAGSLAANTRATLTDSGELSFSPAVAVVRPFAVRIRAAGELSAFDVLCDGGRDAHPVAYRSDGVLEVWSGRAGRFEVVASPFGARPVAGSASKGCFAGAGETASILGLLALGAILVVLAERNLLDPRRLLIPEDVVAAPGSVVKARVIARRDIFPLVDPPLRGADVKLTKGEKSWTARTNEQGVAEFDLGLVEEGLHVYKVECDGTPDELVVAATARPVFVVDIDGTIANCSQATFLLKETRHVRMMKDAASVLAGLAERVQIVYLTARDRALREKTVRWLGMNGFPKAPLLVRRKRYWEQRARDHKIERLKELTGVKIAAGIGDAATDVEAYKAVGAEALHFRREVTAWADVPARLGGLTRRSSSGPEAPPSAAG
jgi:PKD repeat protein